MTEDNEKDVSVGVRGICGAIAACARPAPTSARATPRKNPGRCHAGVHAGAKSQYGAWAAGHPKNGGHGAPPQPHKHSADAPDASGASRGRA